MSHDTEDPSTLRSEVDALRAANKRLTDELADSRRETQSYKADMEHFRSERDYAMNFQAAIWKVTTPAEADTCILTLKEMGAAEIKDRLAPAFLAGAKWWEVQSTGGTMWQSDQATVFAEATRRYPFLGVMEHALTRERDQLAAQLEIARKALAQLLDDWRADYSSTEGDLALPDFEGWPQVVNAKLAVAQLSDPAAALAERDKSVAERCVEILTQSLNFIREVSAARGGEALCGVAKTAIRREFGIEENKNG